MWRLVQKFSFVFVGYVLLVLVATFPLYNHDRLTGPNPLDLSFPYYQTFGLLWVILITIWIHEQIEEKNKGYEFLVLLPIKARHIVGAKFVVALITIGIYVLFYCVAFWSISTSPDYLKPSCAMMLNAGIICLLVTGIIYLCIFKFGYSKLRILLFILMILAIASPLILNLLIFPKLGMDKYEIIGFLSRPHWVWMAAVGLVLYYGMMVWSTRLMKMARR